MVSMLMCWNFQYLFLNLDFGGQWYDEYGNLIWTAKQSNHKLRNIR